MRITETRKAQGPARPRRAAQPATTESFADHLKADGSEDAAATAGATPAQPLSSLLALQEVSDEDAGAGRRAMTHGRTLLEDLEAIRDGLLLGRLSEARLRRIGERLKQQMPTIHDMRLRQIVADIELRVAVELAKLGI